MGEKCVDRQNVHELGSTPQAPPKATATPTLNNLIIIINHLSDGLVLPLKPARGVTNGQFHPTNVTQA